MILFIIMDTTQDITLTMVMATDTDMVITTAMATILIMVIIIATVEMFHTPKVDVEMRTPIQVDHQPIIVIAPILTIQIVEDEVQSTLQLEVQEKIQ